MKKKTKPTESAKVIINNTVHVVTWEYGNGNGGGGFNWYYKAENADKAYLAEIDNFLKSDPSSVVCRFDVKVPDGVAPDAITAWIEPRQTEFSDKARIRCVGPAFDFDGMTGKVKPRKYTPRMPKPKD